jgi:hypothetical protein
MTEQAPVLTRHDLEAKIVKRCWEDEGLAGVFVKYLQVPAASLPKIVVHQETPGSWHIVLPAKPSHIDELSEKDLERVAGGTTPAFVSMGLGILTASITGSAVVASAVETINNGW